MREKRRRPARTDGTTSAGDSGFDAGASVRQIGLFESANGVPHGVVAVVVAFVLAAVTYPLYRLGRRR